MGTGQKLKAEIKEMRQDVARAGNESHRQKQQRKSTKKEKQIMKELETKINGKEATSKNLRIVNEQWLEKLCYKKVKLEKYIEKCNRKKHNIFFQAFSGLWKQWKSAKVKCPRCRDLLSFGEASGSKTSQRQICRGWKS